jgi:hypothetical protein
MRQNWGQVLHFAVEKIVSLPEALTGPSHVGAGLVYCTNFINKGTA